MQILVHKENGKTMKNMYSIMSNLQTNCHLKLDSKKGTNIEEASG